MIKFAGLVVADSVAIASLTPMWSYIDADGTMQTSGVRFVAGSAQVDAYPACSVHPAIIGTPGIGETLETTLGEFLSDPVTSYGVQWTRDGVPIPGATASRYVVQVADAQHVLGVLLRVTNVHGSTVVESINGLLIPSA